MVALVGSLNLGLGIEKTRIYFVNKMVIFIAMHQSCYSEMRLLGTCYISSNIFLYSNRFYNVKFMKGIEIVLKKIGDLNMKKLKSFECIKCNYKKNLHMQFPIQDFRFQKIRYKVNII